MHFIRCSDTVAFERGAGVDMHAAAFQVNAVNTGFMLSFALCSLMMALRLLTALYPGLSLRHLAERTTTRHATMTGSKRHKHHITRRCSRTPAAPHWLSIGSVEAEAPLLQHPLREVKTSTVTPVSRHPDTVRLRLVTQQQTRISNCYTVADAEYRRLHCSTTLLEPTVSAQLLRNTANWRESYTHRQTL
jgi:hypothetical protein